MNDDVRGSVVYLSITIAKLNDIVLVSTGMTVTATMTAD